MFVFLFDQVNFNIPVQTVGRFSKDWVVPDDPHLHSVHMWLYRTWLYTEWTLYRTPTDRHNTLIIPNIKILVSTDNRAQSEIVQFRSCLVPGIEQRDVSNDISLISLSCSIIWSAFSRVLGQSAGPSLVVFSAELYTTVCLLFVMGRQGGGEGGEGGGRREGATFSNILPPPLPTFHPWKITVPVRSGLFKRNPFKL